MTPTLLPGTLVIASGAFSEVRVGDIVVLRHNNTEKIKRISDIGPDTIFVIGDNPNESTDSRQFGWIPADDIIAKVFLSRYRL